jgi:hypothetical protein
MLRHHRGENRANTETIFVTIYFRIQNWSDANTESESTGNEYGLNIEQIWFGYR